MAMMTSAINLLVLLAAVMGSAVGRRNLPCYWTENDYVDVDAVIANVTQLQAYTDCFLDRGPCTSLAWSFKVIQQDTVIHQCDRCNVPQKQQYGRYLLGLKAKLPQDYLRFRQKYDPHNIYFDALEAELSKYCYYTTRETRPTG